MIIFEIEGRVRDSKLKELAYRIPTLDYYALLSPTYEGRLFENEGIFNFCVCIL